MALDGKALTAVGVGALLMYSGVKGWSILGTLGDLITGVPPSQPVTNPLTSPTPSTAPAEGSPSGATAGGLAGIALQYQGHAYRFGGAPGPDGENPWDCSSFVNFVVGVKSGRAVPGYAAGTYRGTVHGPSSGQWAVWSGLARVPRDQVAAGDILVWTGAPGHVGIAISNTQMVSALNPFSKTKVTSISGFGGRGMLVMTGRLK